MIIYKPELFRMLVIMILHNFFCYKFLDTAYQSETPVNI